jgi:hypothetical protein
LCPGADETERRASPVLALQHLISPRIRDGGAKNPAGLLRRKCPAPEKFLARIATSEDDFSIWFREGLVQCHGMDLSVPPPPPPRQVIDVAPGH